MDWTIKKLLTWADSYFSDHGVDSPRLTAEILLAQVLEMRRLDLYLQHDRPLDTGELSEFKILIKRRMAREPVAYITGEKGFFNDTFKVTKGVLIPRPDTELLVETVIGMLNKSPDQTRVIELGVGSGAIIASVASACPDHIYFGCDISDAALDLARANAQKIVQTPFHFFQGSWLDAVGPHAGFDMILSNPPYIPTKDIEGLAPEIRDHEPWLALDGGPEGMDAFRIILDQSGDVLNSGGMVVFEMGFDQKASMTDLASQYPWVGEIQFLKDLAGHNRLAILKK